MKKYLYALTLSMIGISGCGKDEEYLLIVEGQYQADNTLLAANPITMYTKDGRIDNQVVINRFLNHHSWSQSYFSSSDTRNSGNSSLTVAIRSNKHAAITFNYSTRIDSIRTELTAQESKYLVLSEIDSSWMNVPNYSFREVHLHEILSQMHSVDPQKKCYNVPAYSNYSQACRYRFLRLLTIKQGKLFVPQLSYIVQTSQPNYGVSSFGYSGVWNTFNTAALNKLIVGDTIVVQEREVALLKK
jgi:hypothetical protein